MEHEQDRRSAVNLERHLQTLLLTFTVGSITFAATYFYNDNREKGEARAQLKVLTDQVIEVRADIRSMQAGFVRREEYDELKQRVRELEKERR